MQTIIFVTGNQGKIKEAQEILGEQFVIEPSEMELDEIQAIKSSEVVEKKAKQAFEILRKPVLIEDTSLSFETWNGLPGALIRWFLKTVDCSGICKMFSHEYNRKAVAESVFAYYDGNALEIFSGIIEGTVAIKPEGNLGFGWDPIFIPNGFDKTFAEMTSEEKNNISMRKIALEKLRECLVNK